MRKTFLLVDKYYGYFITNLFPGYVYRKAHECSIACLLLTHLIVGTNYLHGQQEVYRHYSNQLDLPGFISTGLQMLCAIEMKIYTIKLRVSNLPQI